MSVPAVRQGSASGSVGLRRYSLSRTRTERLPVRGTLPPTPDSIREIQIVPPRSRSRSQPHLHLLPEQTPHVAYHFRRPSEPIRHSTPTTSRAPHPLRNFGNTCYLNATMQCVLHTPGLLTELAEFLPRLVERRRPAAQALLAFEAPTATNFIQLLLTLKNEAAKLNDEFSGSNQADAHEFLRTFLFVLHGEMNRRVGRKEPYQEMKDVENEGEEAAMQRWQKYLRSVDSSSIYDIYGGVIRSKCICLECGHKSLTFDPFLDLSLPVPSSSLSTHSIEGLICSNFDDVEDNLCSGNKLHCARCKRFCNGKRFLKVVQWPKVLVLHLKRFCVSGKKNGAPIIYPTTLITCSSAPKKYQLFGVVCHHGSERWGHYTSYVCVSNPRHNGSSNGDGTCRHHTKVGATSLPNIKSCANHVELSKYPRDSSAEFGSSHMPGGSWYLCNDAEISPVHVVDVTRAFTQAYILFYSEV